MPRADALQHWRLLVMTFDPRGVGSNPTSGREPLFPAGVHALLFLPWARCDAMEEGTIQKERRREKSEGEPLAL